MIQKMFSIKDQKAGIFYPPFFKNTHGEAERDFHTAVNDKQTKLFQYPEDFDLYYMGTYDDNNGTFQGLDTPLHVKKAISCLPKSPLDISPAIDPHDLQRQ